MISWINNTLSLEEVESLVKENPLTQKTLNYILENNIEKVLLSDVSSMIAACMPLRNDQYTIFIGLYQDLEEQEIGLIHELAHIHYKVGGLTPATPSFGPENEKNKKIENILEKESIRFYKKNRTFVRQIYLDIYNNSQNNDN